MRIILIAFLFTACTTFDGVRCFSIDGKAASSCQRGLKADRLCGEKGLAYYSYGEATCKDESKVRIVE